jgi:hypothetical protein
VAGGSTAAKPGGELAYQLNLSHIFCVDGGVEIHFVLLNIPEGTTPGNLTWYNNGVAQVPTIPPTGPTGNVWHYTVVVPAGSYNVTGATVDVGGTTVYLHNPGDYAGQYNCGEGDVCEVQIPTGWDTAAGEGETVCLDEPLGSENSECGLFGLAPDGKDAGNGLDSQNASKSAPLVIIKDGAVGCNPGQLAYTYYTNVTAGQSLAFHSISHITYCKCPEAPLQP